MQIHPTLQAFASGDDFTLGQLAEGVHWADQSCRIGGNLAMAHRRASGAEITAILRRMQQDGLTTMSGVPAWLNTHAHEMVGD